METTTPPLSWRTKARRLSRVAALAVAAATLGALALALPANAAPVVAPPAPDLEVAIQSAVFDTMANERLGVSTHVTNVGTETTPLTTVRITIPTSIGGSLYTSFSEGGDCTATARVVTCPVGPLAPGETTYAVFWVQDALAGSHTFTSDLTPVSRETSLANNTDTAQLTVFKYGSATTASAPPTAQFGQRITIPVKVTYIPHAGANPPLGQPAGTVAVIGPEGVFQAQVIEGVARVSYPANYRGPHTVAVIYSGSAMAETSSTMARFTVL